MSACVYVSVYICMFVRSCACLCILYVRMCLCMCACSRVFVCACVCACALSVCACVCLYVLVYLCMRAHMFVCMPGPPCVQRWSRKYVTAENSRSFPWSWSVFGEMEILTSFILIQKDTVNTLAFLSSSDYQQSVRRDRLVSIHFPLCY